MSIKIDATDVLAQFKQLGQVPDRVARQAYQYFVAKTPVQSGNARRKTRLQASTITGDYPYAERLDSGYSKQAPDGMTKPTEAYITQLMAAEVKKLGGV